LLDSGDEAIEAHNACGQTGCQADVYVEELTLFISDLQ
jgi:hypothetical protein